MGLIDPRAVEEMYGYAFVFCRRDGGQKIAIAGQDYRCLNSLLGCQKDEVNSKQDINPRASQAERQSDLAC